MQKNLKIVQEQLSDSHLKLILIVSAKEDSGFPDLDFSNLSELSIDLNGLEYLNSHGILSWLRWIAKFPKTLKVNLLNCPKFFVDQLSISRDLLPPNGQLISFQVPFYCEQCADSVYKIFHRKDEIPEEEICPSCGKMAQLDAPKGYLRFLSR